MTICWDTETHLIKPGMVAPRLVCVTTGDGRIYGREEGIYVIERRLIGGDTLVAHNAPFDLSVIAQERPQLLPAIFQRIDEGKVRCTKVRQQMIDNATGELKYQWDEDSGQFKKVSFSLQRLVRHYLGKEIDKGEDTWRLRYNELDGVPLEAWPEDAIRYAIGDAVDLEGVYSAQEQLVQPEGIPQEISQQQAAWAFYLIGAWGVRTELASVDRLREILTKDFNRQVEICQQFDFMRENGTKDMKKIRSAIEEWYRTSDKELKLTPSGQIATDREQLTETDHPGLKAIAEAGRVQKLLTTYVPMLERGTQIPITPSYNSIIETFRSSCRDPNLQNLPRKGNVRDCFIPRPGYVFAFCDYDTLEMLTLAQVCLDLFGYSEIANAAHAGQDFHLALAADMLGMPYSQAVTLYENGDPQVSDARQFCFHPDTEALTKEGWKKIGDLTQLDQVAAAVPRDWGVQIKWQHPTALTKRKCPDGHLIHLKNEGINLRVTRDHRMLAIRGSDGSPEVTTPIELPKKRGWWNAGIAPGGSWSPDERLLRLAVAVQADGHLTVGHQITFGFSKERKVERLRSLLRGVPHRESEHNGVTSFVVFGDNPYPSGVRTEIGIADQIASLLTDKQFDDRWLRLSSEGRRIVIDEARHWDATCRSNSVSYTYCNQSKKSAEILQIIATLEGRKTYLRQDRNTGSWLLTIRDHPERRNDRSRADTLTAKEIPYQGHVVCLSVPSSFVVVRDGGIPVITGQCKIGNYGFGGGMGPNAFQSYAKGYGIEVPLSLARKLHKSFRAKWREMIDYFNYCSFLCEQGGGRARVEFVRSGMVRGNVHYTAVCNGFFQHLAAMGAKRALYAVVKECYLDAGSPLYGSRPWLFAHDEIGMEIPEAAIGPRGVHEAAMRLREIMIESMKFWCPDVPINATVALARRWYKGAKAIYHDGLLVPVRPDGKKWVEDR